MKKKLVAFIVCLVMVMMPMLAACGGGGGGEEEPAAEAAMKVGLICLHDENSTYDLNFINAFNESCKKLGVEGIVKTNVPEGQECYDTAGELVDEDFPDDGTDAAYEIYLETHPEYEDELYKDEDGEWKWVED